MTTSNQELSRQVLQLKALNERLIVTTRRQDVEIEYLRAALKPFSNMAGELFARNWNAGDVVTALDNPNDPHRVTAGDYFAARAAYQQTKNVAPETK